ncbi:hypothetical protein LTR66_006906 [Elasticomyces elasticus]|nr:hypothetical protein LTR66_006906 [Elasticomyces elasticus]
MDYMPQYIKSQLFVTPPLPTTSFTGQTIIVTGANVGLGFEAAKLFVAYDAAKVILAVRDTTKGDTAKSNIEASTGRQNVVQVWNLDMLRYDSVLAFAQRAATELDRLDAAVLNAGMITSEFELSAQGNEKTLEVNVLATFLLFLLLLPKMKETAQKYRVRPHLSIVSSEVHHFATFAEGRVPADQSILKTLNTEETAKMSARYTASKAMEILIFNQICTEIRNAHPDASTSYPVILNILNPGFCHSNFFRDKEPWYVYLSKVLTARRTEVGARTLVHAASAGPESWGEYLSDSGVQAMAKWVLEPEGEQVGKRVWSEVKEVLEKAKPGLLQNI